MTLASLYATDFVALKHTDTVAAATGEMLRNRVTDLPVVDDDGKLLGMFKLARLLESLLPKAALIGYGINDLTFVSVSLAELRQHMRDIDSHSVCDYVVAPEHTLAPDGSALELVLLLYRGANNVPVIAGDGKLVGMVSARELLGALHEGQ